METYSRVDICILNSAHILNIGNNLFDTSQNDHHPPYKLLNFVTCRNYILTVPEDIKVLKRLRYHLYGSLLRLILENIFTKDLDFLFNLGHFTISRSNHVPLGAALAISTVQTFRKSMTDYENGNIY